MNLPEAPALVARSVSKQFPDAIRPAVNQVSLSVPRGEIVGLLGANGAGKTTLLRIFASLLLPSEGTAAVCGKDVVGNRAAVRASVGALFGGAAGLYERLTVRENLAYFARLGGVDRRSVAGRIETLVRLFGMEEFSTRPVAHCSSGMKQRTALARAMVHEPEVLLLDEPSTGLDIEATLALQECVRGVRNAGTTVLVSSHNTAELAALCARVVIMTEGHLVAEVGASEFGGGSGLHDRYLAEQRGRQ